MLFFFSTRNTVVADTIYQHVYIGGLNCLLEDYYTGAMIYFTRSRNKVFILIWYMWSKDLVLRRLVEFNTERRILSFTVGISKYCLSDRGHTIV